MAQSYDDNGIWVECPPGTLRTAAASLGARSVDTRRRFLAGVATGVIVAAIGLGVISARQHFFSTSGPISCSECQALLQRFAGNDLSSESTTRVRQHLSDCPSCQAAYDSMSTTVSQLSSSLDSEDLIDPRIFQVVGHKLRAGKIVLTAVFSGYGDGESTRIDGRTNSVLAVFEHQHRAGLDIEPLGCRTVDFRMRLSSTDVLRRKHELEATVELSNFQTVIHETAPTAGGDGFGDLLRFESFQ